MPFQIVRNDITRVKADAIVNTANPMPVIGEETDRAIYAAAKEELLAARERIGEIIPGNAAYTDAFRLSAKYIIHTVGPGWLDGEHGELETLSACYKNSLSLADELACRSIAFPLIASGDYGFPKDLALEIALQEIRQFLLTHEMKVTLVVFDRKTLELSLPQVRGIREYIDDCAVRRISNKEYRETSGLNRRRRTDLIEDENSRGSGLVSLMSPGIEYVSSVAKPIKRAEFYGKISNLSLEELMEQSECTFQKKLFQLIDASGMTDVEVYKRANLDRKVFSSIRCKPDYRPKKKTAIALAIALKLNMSEMIDLLARAEIAFSPDKKSDMIIMYFVEHEIYDIFVINAALFRYGQPTLGC